VRSCWPSALRSSRCVSTTPRQQSSGSSGR
jgi:hypothetical protein